MKITVILGLFLVSLTTSCRKDELPPKHPTLTYVFLGHIYESSSTMDPRVEQLNFDLFDQIWLGGDIYGETSSDFKKIVSLDDKFNLSSTSTHWAIGNHDILNGNPELIYNATKRPSHYATYINGITIMVLNTTFGETGFYDETAVNNQFSMIELVCDTISASSHLIVLTHHANWDKIDDQNNVGQHANTNYFHYFFRVNPDHTYETSVYPLLLEVQERGVQVIQIAGDFGQKSNKYEYTAPSGVQFLGSGITSQIVWNEQFPTAGHDDLILLIHHNPHLRRITWEFRALDQ